MDRLILQGQGLHVLAFQFSKSVRVILCIIFCLRVSYLLSIPGEVICYEVIAMKIG